MLMNPLVSAIVPVYNGERYLSEALDSALAQTYPNVEIIVVDDGSTDLSQAIAAQYAREHPEKVHVIHQANGGTGAARNTAIKAARGSYIAMLDQDDVWTPAHLAEAIAVLESDPSVGLVHANIRILEDRILDDGTLDNILHPPMPRSWLPSDDVFVRILLRQAHIPCLTVVFRRSLVELIGGFAPEFFRLGNDDRDMWLRISKIAGVRYIDSVHGCWRRHGNNQSGNFEKMRKGQFLLVERHAVGPHRALRNRAIAAVYAEMAYEQLHSDGARLAALLSYSRALCRYPFQMEAWKGAARALVGLRDQFHVIPTQRS